VVQEANLYDLPASRALTPETRQKLKPQLAVALEVLDLENDAE